MKERQLLLEVAGWFDDMQTGEIARALCQVAEEADGHEVRRVIKLITDAALHFKARA